MKHDDGEDEETDFGNLLLRDGNDSTHNHDDRDNGNSRKGSHGSVNLGLEDRFDDQAENNRQDHDLNNGPEHRDRIHVNPGVSKEINQCRSHDRSKNGAQRGNSHGKRDVAASQISHHVGGCTAWAAADQNDADGNVGRKIKD